MAWEIIAYIFSGIIKFFTLVWDALYSFFMATLPKFMALVTEIARKFAGWVITEYARIRAEIKWHSLKKPKKLLPRRES